MIEKTTYEVIKPKDDVVKKEKTPANQIIVEISETETRKREVNLASLDGGIDILRNAIVRHKESIVGAEKSVKAMEVERARVKEELEKSLGIVIKDEVKLPTATQSPPKK